MTSPLVKPLSGKNTFSTFEIASSRPSTSMSCFFTRLCPEYQRLTPRGDAAKHSFPVKRETRAALQCEEWRNPLNNETGKEEFARKLRVWLLQTPGGSSLS